MCLVPFDTPNLKVNLVDTVSSLGFHCILTFYKFYCQCNEKNNMLVMSESFFFFKYSLDDIGRVYAVLEVVTSHFLGAPSLCIPNVVPFKSDEVKKIVTVNIADIRTVVGLLNRVHHTVNGRTVAYK